MSEVIGFNGPIYMTHPTKAIVPILYEDLRKLYMEYKGKNDYFSTQTIKNCMKKVTAIDLQKNIMVDNELEIKAYYAGHVLGAAMFWIKVGSQTVVYTGDFNMNPDRHLGAACIDKCQPDLLIVESMYATKTQNEPKSRNENFVKLVHECMSRGGKVLIPVFVLGRAQEICILLNTYWEKMNLSYPIYFSTNCATAKANSYYKLFKKWTNNKMDDNIDENMFNFKHIKPFDDSCISKPEPMVILASNAMLHAGLSLKIFKEWAHDEKNLIIFPDICKKGTLGHKVAAGSREIELSNKETIKPRIKTKQMCFDAVADAKGIIKLIEECDPKNIILAHGKKDILISLQNDITNKLKLKCLIPTYGEICSIETPLKIPSVTKSSSLNSKIISELCAIKLPNPEEREIKSKNYWILTMHKQRIAVQNLQEFSKKTKFIRHDDKEFKSKIIFEESGSCKIAAEKILVLLKEQLIGWSIKMEEDNVIMVEDVKIIITTDGDIDSKHKIVTICWAHEHEDIAVYILYMLHHIS